MKKLLRRVFSSIVILLIMGIIAAIFIQLPLRQHIWNAGLLTQTPSAHYTSPIIVAHSTQQNENNTSPTESHTPTVTPSVSTHSGAISKGSASGTLSGTSSGPTNTTIPSTIPHAVGAHLVNAQGQPLVLHGAQIESSFINPTSWFSGNMPTTLFTETLFITMAQGWNMNAVRLPLSNWIYARDSINYVNQLDVVVQRANAAGLYVILDLHDNAKSGSPYGTNVPFPKTEDITFWRTIAGHFQSNPMVMFDVFNEPQSNGWQAWLHGGGTVDGATIVGMQDLVNAIRSVGARQIVIVEPGLGAVWYGITGYLINDANVMYSLHIYSGIASSAQSLDNAWSSLLNHYPIFYGEWGAIVNTYTPVQCGTIPHAQADQIVTNFLNYMASRNANWTAWEFTPYHLIQDYTTFTPTTLDIPWTCGDTTSHAGMGTIVRNFLTGK
ncbi:MAG TPA: hypothetical protein DHW02_13945 [Ktedonobacter sp.]|nr:hypothetical protein [Ktedonobacter sp.]